jgi:hypothetical protein
MVLVRALYGRRPWLELELTWEAPWGSSPERGGRGKERGTARWVPWGGGGGRAQPGLLCLPIRDYLLYVREESRKEKRREREKKRREGKKSDKISNLEISKKIKDNL